MADLITTEELAAKWRIKPKTLINWRSMRAGPPYVKIVGAVRYSQRAAAEWLAQQQNDRGGAA